MMESVFGIRFSTSMNMKQMFEALCAGKLPLEWSMREGEYDGDYIKGTTSDRIKVRVVDAAKEDAKGGFEFEIYFPSLGREIPDDRKMEFLDSVRRVIFPLIRAKE